MKVKELMERVGAADLPTGRAIAYIKDGLEEINIISETHIRTIRKDIVSGQRFYTFPADAVKVLNVRAKNHLNSKDEYRQIHEPKIKDSDGV